jgi:AraC-like DNA-binding protein
MKYEIIPPTQFLAPYVRYFWTMEGDEINGLSKAFGSMVDGCPGMMFQHSLLMDEKQLPDTFLYGQTTKHISITATQQFSSIGVIFHPNALKSVFGISAAELTNTCINPDIKGYLQEQLSEATTLLQQVKILQSYLQKQVIKNHVPVDKRMEHAISLLSNNSLSLKQLQEVLQLTEKSFERKFKEYVGIPPKLYSRICRYQASLHQLRNNEYNKLSDIAYENDYADQAHFIRSFKEFTGCSPLQFQKRK